MATGGAPNLVNRFDDWLDDEVSPRVALLTYAALGLYFTFLLLPLLALVVSSVSPPSVLYSGRVFPSAGEITLENYAAVLGSARFRRYAVNSVIVATSTTALTVGLSSLAAYGLSAFEFPGRRWLLVGYLGTQMLPWVLILVPFFLLMFTLGLVDTFPGVILAHTALALPITTWLLKGYFDDIPDVLRDAGRMDGCSQLGVLRHVVLPLSMPGVTVAGFYTFVLSWSDYLAVSVLTQTGATRTLAPGVRMLALGNWRAGLAAAVLMAIPVIVLYALVRHRLVDGLAGSNAAV